MIVTVVPRVPRNQRRQPHEHKRPSHSGSSSSNRTPNSNHGTHPATPTDSRAAPGATACVADDATVRDGLRRPSRKIIQKMQTSALRLVEMAHVRSPKHIQFIHQKEDAMVYQVTSAASLVSPKDELQRPSDYVVKGVTTIDGDVLETMRMLRSADSERFRSIMRRLFGKYFVHGMMLENYCFDSSAGSFFSQESLHSQDRGRVSSQDRGRASSKSLDTERVLCFENEDDAFTVQWMALQPLKNFSNSDNTRDFTFASYQDLYEVVNGLQFNRLGISTESERQDTSRSQKGTCQKRLVGVQAWTSFNFRDVPVLPEWGWTERLHFQNTGFVVEPTNDPGISRISFFVSLVPINGVKGSTKQHKWLQELATCVGRLSRLVTPSKVLTWRVVPKNLWKKKDFCYMCMRAFRTFRRCHHCRFCGEPICSKCSSFLDLMENGALDAIASCGDEVMYKTFLTMQQEAVNGNESETRGCTRCIERMTGQGSPPQSESTSVGSKGSLSLADSSGSSFSAEQSESCSVSKDEPVREKSGSSTVGTSASTMQMGSSMDEEVVHQPIGASTQPTRAGEPDTRVRVSTIVSSSSNYSEDDLSSSAGPSFSNASLMSSGLDPLSEPLPDDYLFSIAKGNPRLFSMLQASSGQSRGSGLALIQARGSESDDFDSDLEDLESYGDGSELDELLDIDHLRMEEPNVIKQDQAGDVHDRRMFSSMRESTPSSLVPYGNNTKNNSNLLRFSGRATCPAISEDCVAELRAQDQDHHSPDGRNDMILLNDSRPKADDGFVLFQETTRESIAMARPKEGTGMIPLTGF